MQIDASLPPGTRFRERPDFPEMIVLPPGNFEMGQSDLPDDWDYPKHNVAIAYPFALGVYAVTNDEWDARLAKGGCNGYRPADQDWSRGGRLPVVDISWHDAKAYVQSLNAELEPESGLGPYHLPTEAEWEYAVRGGTASRYFWGDDADDTDQGRYSH